MSRIKPHQIEPGYLFVPSAGRSPRLVPYGVKLRAVNLVPPYFSGAAEPWAKLFAQWSTYWTSYVKKQIDTAANAGANAIRFIGSINAVLGEGMTTEAYITAYEQFVDYCANLDLYVYGCLSAVQQWPTSTPLATITPIMAAQAEMLHGKPNVIGIDVVQELGLTDIWTGYGHTKHSFVAALFTPVRAVTNLPLTCSVLGGGNSSSAQFTDTSISDFADLVDFYDYHPYYSGMTVAHVTPAANAAAAVGKPIILGEFGATTTEFQRYEAAAAVVNELTNVVGAFAWAIADRPGGTPPSLQYGMYDESWVPRTALVTAFQTIPDHDGPRRAGHVLLDESARLPARSHLNFTGAGVTAADAPSTDATTVTIPGLTVQDENVDVATGVTRLDFQGAGVAATVGTGEVVVTIPGSTGSGELLMQDGVTAPPVPIETEAQDDWLYQD